MVLRILHSSSFKRWWSQLRDHRARALITSRLDRLAFGHFGAVKALGNGISELRIHHGPGYRVYLLQRGATLVVLLCAGDKSSQAADIKTAARLAQQWSSQHG